MTQAHRQLAPAGVPAAPALAPPPLPLVRRWDLRQSLMLAVLLTVWLFARPWTGIWHDGRLYAAQALHRLHPEQFKHDLFFLFGSQDAFTLFSPLYSACIAALGLDGASLLLQTAGSALWLGAAYYLLSTLLRGPMLWIGLAWLLLLPTDYDAIKVFSLAEPYLTPRIFGEAAGMAAIACVLRKQWRRAALAVSLSLVMHPLMTLGTLLFGLLYLGKASLRRLVPLAAAAGLAVGAGCALDVAPFNRLLHTMDTQWFAHVARLSAIVTWEGWRFGEMASRTVVAFSLVLTAAWLSGGWRARFYYCVALAGGLGLLATWLGTCVFHNLLMLQIQPWRALWLVQLVAIVAVSWLLAAFWHRGRVFQLLLAACMLGVFARDSYGGLVTLLAGAALCWAASRAQPTRLPNRIYGLACCLLAALATIWLAEVDAQATYAIGVRHWNYARGASDGLAWGLTLLRLGGGALLGMALVLGIWHCARQRTPGWTLLALAVAGLPLAGVAWMRYAQVGSQPYVSAAGARAVQARFLPLIPPQATVYWENELRFSWFVLQRASYASLPQIFGMVFNRGTAMEGVRRLNRLERLGAPDVVWGRDRADTQRILSQARRPDADALAYVCQDPALDFVVLTERLGGLAVAQANDAPNQRSYFLYDCARLRGSDAAH